jgi:hypothetical protein
MNELRMILVAALCGAALTACGDDDVRPVTDAGPRDLGQRDMNTPPVDQGPPVDSGSGADLGPAGSCPAGPCDLVANGCATGEGCYFLSSATGAAPAPMCQASGIGVTGSSCTTYSNCAPGYTCIGATATTPGACEKYCCDTGSSAGCPSGATCSITLTDSSGNPTGAALCHAPSNCAIFGADCAPGEACTLFGGDGSTDCSEAGTLTEGQTCIYANHCVPGFGCVNSGGASTCQQLCNTTAGGAPACPVGQTCNTLNIPAPLTNVGACSPTP